MKYGVVNRYLLKVIPLQAKRILDVGCGPGVLAGEIKRLRKCEIVGITISEAEAQEASKVLDKALVRDLNKYDPREMGKFDCILCSHILEHLSYPKTLLELLRNNLTDDGILIVAVPNGKQRFVEFLKTKSSYAIEGPLDYTHKHFFSYQAALELIRTAGYKVSSIFFDGHFPLPVIRNLSKSLARIVDRIAIKVAPGLFAIQIIFIAGVDKQNKAN
jgi:2-polyprenyl-3-methyl-5-hydroxy-6-metoxy-1,4-benzoquinol methylase